MWIKDGSELYHVVRNQHTVHKGHPPSADLRYRGKDSISPCTLILAAIKGSLGIYTLYTPSDIPPLIYPDIPKLALYGSKNKCAWTATVFFPISQVCARGVTLHMCMAAADSAVVLLELS